MGQQLSFDLPLREAGGRGAFFVSPSNAEALAQIDRWRDWPGSKLALIGPMGSGKSHLARVWAEDSGARLLTPETLLTTHPDPGAWVVEDADRIAGASTAETALFHLHNYVLAEGGRLLLTGRSPPARWPVKLPDLASRLAATALTRIAPPDEPLLAALLVKLFSDRQIAPPPSLISWLVPRMERSFAEAQRLVDTLDTLSLSTGRPIGIDLARTVLLGPQPLP